MQKAATFKFEVQQEIDFFKSSRKRKPREGFCIVKNFHLWRRIGNNLTFVYKIITS
jgi:hypothetical protein